MIEKINGFTAKNGTKFDVEISYSGLQTLNHISFVINDINIINNIPRIESHIISNNKMVSGIFIDDIQGEPVSNGYGTVLMNCLIEFCKRNNIKFISGNLYDGDLEDHKDRLINFYKKFNFDVHINENGKSGSIRLELK